MSEATTDSDRAGGNMTEETIIKELSEMHDVMRCLGDIKKAKVLKEAVKLIKKLKEDNNEQNTCN